jgi:two-component system, OmpR family, sensor kinase
MRHLRIRTRLLAVVIVGTALILAILVAAFNVALRRTLDGDATSTAQARAAATLATLVTTNGRIAAGETPDDAAVDTLAWIYQGTRLVEGPQASTMVTDAATSRAALAAPTVADGPGRLRLASLVVADHGQPIGAVVAAVPLAPYQATERTALIASTLLAVAALAAISLLAAWTLRRALSPVHEMTRLASAWSEHDLDRRFAQGSPHDELTELAATLDTMLGRIAASLEREQRFSAELAHELRTPLARIAAESELALQTVDDPDASEAFRAIARSADEIRRTIDTLLAAARHQAGHRRGTSDLARLVAETADRYMARGEDRGTAIRATAPRPAMVAVEPDLALRIIEPVLENALRHAHTTVELAVCPAANGHAELRITDDGPGIAPDLTEKIFEPGYRGEGGDSAGLGLALARRLATDVGGTLTAEPADQGARFTIRLPVA